MKLFKRENESMGTVHFDSSEVSQNELSPSTHLMSFRTMWRRLALCPYPGRDYRIVERFICLKGRK